MVADKSEINENDFEVMKLRFFRTTSYLIPMLFVFITFIGFEIGVEAQIQQNEETEVESVKTLKGNLQLIKHTEDGYINKVSLRLKDKVLLEAPYQYLSIKGNLGKQPETLFLVFWGTDALTCIGKFVVVDLSGYSPKVTEEFGNCSDAPEITYANKPLSLISRTEQKVKANSQLVKKKFGDTKTEN